MKKKKKNVNLPNLKAFADDKLDVTRIMKSVPEIIKKNIVGKGENACNQHFLLFPKCFLIYLFSHCLLNSGFHRIVFKLFSFVFTVKFTKPLVAMFPFYIKD